MDDEAPKKRRSRVLEYYAKKEEEAQTKEPAEGDESIFQDTLGELGLDEFGTEPFK